MNQKLDAVQALNNIINKKTIGDTKEQVYYAKSVVKTLINTTPNEMRWNSQDNSFSLFFKDSVITVQKIK